MEKISLWVLVVDKSSEVFPRYIAIWQWLYRGADKSLARPGRKQANVSVRMAWISFGALPCRKRNLMAARVAMLLISRASLTCFRACFLPGRAKDLLAPRYIRNINSIYKKCEGRDSSVSIKTCYGLDGLGIESRWGWDFPYLSRTALGPTQLPIQWVPSLFPRDKTAGE